MKEWIRANVSLEAISYKDLMKELRAAVKELYKVKKAEAKKKFPGDRERQDKYVYGTLRKTGWTPSHQKGKKK